MYNCNKTSERWEWKGCGYGKYCLAMVRDGELNVQREMQYGLMDPLLHSLIAAAHYYISQDASA